MNTQNDLIGKYLIAVSERNALEEGTLTPEETAGYWLFWACHNPRREFNDMLKENDIVLSNNSFYSKVNKFLTEVGI